MSAKAYHKPTAAFFGYVGQNLSGQMTDEDMAYWQDHPDELKLFLSGLVRERARQAPRFELVAQTQLDATSSQPTTECFRDERWEYRDASLNTRFSAQQPETPVCTLAALMPVTHWNQSGAVRAVLGTSETRVDQLARLLAESPYVLTFPQIEQLVRLTEDGQDTGLLRHHGEGRNSFFVKTGNPRKPVECCQIFGNRGKWRVQSAGEFPTDQRRDPGGRRLLFSNVDAAQFPLALEVA